MTKRIIAIALTVCILFGFCITAGARGVLASEYIDNVLVQVTANGGSKMKIYVFATGTGIMDRIGVSEIIIKEAPSLNGPWSEYDTWSCSGPSYYEENSLNFNGEFSFNGTPGRYYRVYVTAYAMMQNSGSDDAFIMSDAKKCT